MGGGSGDGSGSGDMGCRMVVVVERTVDTCGHVWSHVARFGKHAPSGHKRPLVPLAINAVMAQLARMLIFVPISLCSNLMSAFFFVIYYYYY